MPLRKRLLHAPEVVACGNRNRGGPRTTIRGFESSSAARREVEGYASPMAQRGREKGDDPCHVPDTAAQSAADGAGKITLHSHIGDQLRRMFDEVVAEPIPDKLKSLLETLEKPKPEPG